MRCLRFGVVMPLFIHFLLVLLKLFVRCSKLGLLGKLTDREVEMRIFQILYLFFNFVFILVSDVFIVGANVWSRCFLNTGCSLIRTLVLVAPIQALHGPWDFFGVHIVRQYWSNTSFAVWLHHLSLHWKSSNRSSLGFRIINWVLFQLSHIKSKSSFSRA